MGDVHIPQEDPTTSQRIGAKVAGLIESGHSLYASSVTGSPTGRTRRPTLFLVAFAAIAIGYVWAPALVIALIAIAMLAYTDAVVEL